jgi:hypothetical protein
MGFYCRAACSWIYANDSGSYFLGDIVMYILILYAYARMLFGYIAPNSDHMFVIVDQSQSLYFMPTSLLGEALRSLKFILLPPIRQGGESLFTIVEEV